MAYLGQILVIGMVCLFALYCGGRRSAANARQEEADQIVSSIVDVLQTKPDLRAVSDLKSQFMMSSDAHVWKNVWTCFYFSCSSTCAFRF